MKQRNTKQPVTLVTLLTYILEVSSLNLIWNTGYRDRKSFSPKWKELFLRGH